MVDYARRNHGHTRISYEVLDITTPDVSVFLDEHGKFDRIYSFLCLQWIRDQEAAFRNIGRLLKEDGECLLFFSAPFYLFDVWLEMAGTERWKGSLGDLKDIFPDIWHRDPSPSLSDLENSLRRLITDAGMTTLACEVYSTEAYYPTLEVLLAVLLPIVLVKSGTSEKETSSMRSELSSRLMKRFKMTPRGCSVPVDLFLFHTKKVFREGPTDV
ncbi:acid methyltransferase, putative [Ixodes scapularis]|uniref:Acid methyltransferase, putative n=1 Tax=Ixodes scapularis TaxID=6945 RepID=B7PSL5_IXOSC|nr:acid methyltransferase, putative [Ixodes scapularis]|eukprot:XP_002402715.1 acid methyltransferase, putative [Ixodes scapularis]